MSNDGWGLILGFKNIEKTRPEVLNHQNLIKKINGSFHKVLVPKLQQYIELSEFTRTIVLSDNNLGETTRTIKNKKATICRHEQSF